MYYTYVLKSKTDGQFYIGYTSDIISRLKLHNLNFVRSTKNSGPWEIYYKEEFNNIAEAIRREKQLKSWKKRKAIERLKFLNKIVDPRSQQDRDY